MKSLLIVDDEAPIRDLMARWAIRAGYLVAGAGSATEALAIMARAPADVVFCDIRMPEQDGLWLAGELQERFPEAAVVMATGDQDLGGAIASLQNGAVDYVVKPFDRGRMCEALGRAVGRHGAAVAARRRHERLQAEIDVRQTQLAGALERVDTTSTEALDALLSVLTIHDPTGRGHALRVARLAVGLGLALGLEEPELTDVEHGALLHDIGKAGVPETLLEKPGPLTVEERDVVRRHPRLGFDVLSCVPFLAKAAPIVLHSHERYDGGGYPAGLNGRAIPLGSRIVAVADTFDSMTQPHFQRTALGTDEAVRRIVEERGRQFDPAVVDALTRIRHSFLDAMSPSTPGNPGRASVACVAGDHVVPPPLVRAEGAAA